MYYYSLALCISGRNWSIRDPLSTYIGFYIDYNVSIDKIIVWQLFCYLELTFLPEKPEMLTLKANFEEFGIRKPKF